MLADDIVIRMKYINDEAARAAQESQNEGVAIAIFAVVVSVIFVAAYFDQKNQSR